MSDQPSERSRLEQHGVRPRKSFGQNFLLDPRLVELMVERAAWGAGRHVLEIGPGAGALTDGLLRAGHQVLAVERDESLEPLLRERFARELGTGQFELRLGDALELRDSELPSALTHFAGNLPYGITTPLLRFYLARRERFESALLMVQREYGERLTAEPGTREYGSLTVFVAAQAAVRNLLRVGRSSFWPRPGVESIVVALLSRRPAPTDAEVQALETILRAAFGQRRKTLLNGLAAGLGWEKPRLEARLREIGLDPGVRGETLPLQTFERLAAEFRSER